MPSHGPVSNLVFTLSWGKADTRQRLWRDNCFWFFFFQQRSEFGDVCSEVQCRHPLSICPAANEWTKQRPSTEKGSGVGGVNTEKLSPLEGYGVTGFSDKL